MEKIELKYTFDYKGEKNTIKCTLPDKKDRGLHDYEVCALFEAFMAAIGFSEQNVVNYFRD